MVRDIKQASFRLNSDDTERFKAFCEETEMTAAQGFSALIEIMELDRAGKLLPARKTEIENFEQLTKSIVSAFLHSLELNENAENRIREQFSMQLESQAQTISDYQNQIKTMQLQLEESMDFAEAYRSDLQVAQENVEEATKLRLQYESDIAVLKEDRDKQLSDKENIIGMLTDKLMVAEQKAEGYDDLKAENLDLRAKLTALEQTLKDNRKDAEIALERALNALSKEKDKEREQLQSKLTSQISDLQQILLINERTANEQLRKLDKENANLRETLAELKAQKQQSKQQQTNSQKKK